jgi:7,8-dihydropterin-6-yl-methyl-4-(beta-D-ribofuranosyl)aminobenzene 5'-phosphate synthase
MGLRITTLSENTADTGDLLAEHGLSILIETGKGNILFDTGQTITAGYNTDNLEIDLKQIDKIVLSHGHNDHTGGLRQILRKMGKEVEVIAHLDIWAAKYRRRKGKKDKYIGIPFQRQELESLGARFTLTTKPVQVADNIMTTGEVPMVTDYETIDSGLFVKEDTGWQPDKLLDDLSLIINTKSGLVVVLGCAHRGMINTLYHAQQLTGVKRIHAVIGGSHLVHASEERIRLTIAALKELDVPKLGLCHCTSLPAISLLAQEFGDKFFFNIVGTIFEAS